MIKFVQQKNYSAKSIKNIRHKKMKLYNQKMSHEEKSYNVEDAFTANRKS